MPIKTTLVTFSPLAFNSREKDSTCSAISDGERTLLKPRCPVAQKEQSIWQPASVETHTVRLPSPCLIRTCLLYTSDAADDLLCVDLGGRRIIKKKKKKKKEKQTK